MHNYTVGGADLQPFDCGLSLTTMQLPFLNVFLLQAYAHNC